MRRQGGVLLVAVTLLAGSLATFIVLLVGFQGKAREDVGDRYDERARLSASLMNAVFASSGASAQSSYEKRFGEVRVPEAALTSWARRNRSQTVELLDGAGRLLGASAGTPPAVRAGLGARPAYVKQVLAGRPFSLSNVLRAPDGSPVVHFAQPFKTAQGKRILVTGFEPDVLFEFFAAYLRSVPLSGGHAYVLDSNGIIIGATGGRAQAGRPVAEPGFAAALARAPGGTFGRTYYASTRVAGSPWRVAFTADEARLFASVRGARMWLPWVIIAAFGVAALGALALLRRSMRNATKLRLSLERYALVVHGANDGIWDHDLVTDDFHLSPRWMEILGLPAGLPQRPDQWLDRVHPDDRGDLEAAVRAHLDDDAPTIHNEHRIQHADGGWRWVLIRGIATRDAGGRPTRMAGSMSDVTLVKLAEEQLRHDALHDALTGLANRTLFLDRLTALLERGRRNPERRTAVLFLDLDRFKLINDSFSHAVGDELLVELGRRLRAVLRPGDTVARGGPMDTIARLGGDEFTVLLDDVGSAEAAVEVAERILATIADPFLVHGRRVSISASLGIALDHPGSTAAEMMRNADLAMYDAKRLGKARWAVYNEVLHEQVTGRLQVEMALRGALDDGSLRVFYQPVIDLGTGAVTGFEALARWPAHLPAVTPDVFIEVADDAGLIDRLGRLVLSRACVQMSRWREQGLVGEDATMSVNVAGSQLAEPAVLVADVRAALLESGLPAHALCLEITEGTIIAEPERAKETLQTLEELGVRAHIDDFGTGYSSLAFLHHFPGETLKIDRSFISAMHEDESHFEIVRAIVALAHSLDLATVAEGIDDPQQLPLLRDLGCEYGQGFLFARPLSPAEVPAFTAGQAAAATVWPRAAGRTPWSLTG